jgi:ribonuclease BN (tRNA processing enzyme)
MGPPVFPIGPEGLEGSWSFDSIDEGEHSIEGFTVLAREIPHKGGRTFGFRISDDAGGILAYLSDHAPQQLGWGPEGVGAYHHAACELAAGADVLIHDSQYRRDELPACASYGHSVGDYAAALGAEVGVRQVMLFHHDPSRTDADVRILLEEVRSRYPEVSIDVATESTVLDI